MSDIGRVQKGMMGYSRLVGKDYVYFREKEIFNFRFSNFQLRAGYHLAKANLNYERKISRQTSKV